ncbi:SDR family oxidoreductase [Puniceicoccales bacterium CK1056]|uniref:SDR family oxidoreductase n=1 Tax=Oceanipulchritudo coccoides TaxID=2706888 RepID=A0A6B2M218_9BACT|nr:SDR family oxidoreductase [Oceanipulchritudo coccoides]NDV62127.1 SDR family oxidoreductase [Oceanipulchritudo coccoides]
MNKLIQELFSLEGKVALVIGGTGELCGAMAGGLAGAGARVLLVGRNEEKAKARMESILTMGGKAEFIKADVSTKAALETLLSEATSLAGEIDIVINGAGVNSPTPFLDVEEEELDRIMNLNFKSVYLACQIFGGYLVERGKGGNIINVGSMSGMIPLSRVFTYSASKAAVHNLSKNLAREWATKGVRVNTIVPGFFPAEQNRKVLTEERVAQIMGHTPMKRFGNAGELVGATLLLASDKAGSFITGHELVVDGGYACMTI